MHFWVVNPPTEDELAVHYENSGGDAMRSRPGRVFAKARNLRMRKEVRKQTCFLGLADVLIDIGAGDGSFSDIASEVVKCYSIDLYPEEFWSGKSAYRQIEIPMHESLAKVDVPFACSHVNLRHVVEHIHQPRDLMNTLKNLGVRSCSITVPNAASPLSKFLGNFWYYWDPPRHLHGFTESSMRELLKESGWSIKEISYQSNDEIVSSLHRKLLLLSQESRGTGFQHLAKLLSPVGLLAGPFNLLPSKIFKSTLVCSAWNNEFGV